MPKEVIIRFTLVSYLDHKKSIRFRIDSKGNYFLNEDGTPTGCGAPIVLSRKQLIEQQNDFFPNFKLRLLAKLIFWYDDKSLDSSQPAAIILKRTHENMRNCDVKFKSSDGEFIPAHEHILIASSDVFNAMFKHDGTTENTTRIIDTSDLHSDIIKDLLRFIYCEAFFEKLENAEKQEIALYNAAEKYQIEKLKTICLNSVYNRLNVGNVLEFTEFAELFDLKELKSCCLLIIIA